jgi:hypothetical protein
MAATESFATVKNAFYIGFILLLNINFNNFGTDSVPVTSVRTFESDLCRSINNECTFGLPQSTLFTPCAWIYNCNGNILWTRPPGGVPFRPRGTRSFLTSFVALLLLTVEPNPGPSAVSLGVLNARSAVHKGALIDDIVQDNQLDILAVSESWIRESEPDAIKKDIAPPNYSVLHVHRSTKTKGGRPCTHSQVQHSCPTT